MDFDEKSEPNINFVPCVTWVRRGVAKPVPERVKLTAEELAEVINQTKKNLENTENDGEDSDNEDEMDLPLPPGLQTPPISQTPPMPPNLSPR